MDYTRCDLTGDFLKDIADIKARIRKAWAPDYLSIRARGPILFVIGANDVVLAAARELGIPTTNTEIVFTFSNISDKKQIIKLISTLSDAINACLE